MTTDNSDDRYTQFYDERGNGPDVIRMDVEPMPTVIERNCHLVFARSEDDDFHATRFVPGGYRLDDRSSQWLMGRLMLWMSGQLVFTGYKDAARNLPGPIDVAGIVAGIPDALRVELRDALTAAIDAPRLAARATAEVVASDEFDDDAHVYLLRTTDGEWGVRFVDDSGRRKVVADWHTGPDAERTARADYADARNKAICICGAEVGEDEIDRSGDEPQCPKCVAAAVEAFKATKFTCVPLDGPGYPGGCGWVGTGADIADTSDGEPFMCPACDHLTVEEISK